MPPVMSRLPPSDKAAVSPNSPHGIISQALHGPGQVGNDDDDGNLRVPFSMVVVFLLHCCIQARRGTYLHPAYSEVVMMDVKATGQAEARVLTASVEARNISREQMADRRRGPTHEASAYGARNCRFESCRGHLSQQARATTSQSCSQCTIQVLVALGPPCKMDWATC